jgi:hypothetical protein
MNELKKFERYLTNCKRELQPSLIECVSVRDSSDQLKSIAQVVGQICCEPIVPQFMSAGFIYSSPRQRSINKQGLALTAQQLK